MKERSEFYKILQNLIKPTESIKQEPLKQEQNKNVKVEFIFQQNPDFKVKVFHKKDGYRNHAMSKASESRLEVENKTVNKEQVKVNPPQAFIKPVVRVKRKLTIDQVKAMENFSKLGALNINDESTLDEIKSAYRVLAKKFHPDINPQGVNQFKLLSQEYKKLIKGF